MGKYADWIAANVPSRPLDVRAMCGHYSRLMAEAFPELILKAGAVTNGIDGGHHWWLETAEGEIVDPTAHQFRGGPLTYTFIPPEERPLGKCMNCGDLCWPDVPGASSYACSTECETALARAYGGSP